MSKQDICAVIPAAGRGSRLGLGIPKLLAPLAANYTVWSHLRECLTYQVGRIHVVVAPAFWDAVCRAVAADPQQQQISVGIQEEPRGMGDAIFGAFAEWVKFKHILIIWGDQAGLSSRTLERVMALHGSGAGPRCTLPVLESEGPYVQYVFRESALIEVRQMREGAAVDARGLSDVGVFLLETAGLDAAWRQYTKTATAGAVTGEVNFLPFLAYLSARCGWTFQTVKVTDPAEARGINTPEDLRFFQDRYASLYNRVPAHLSPFLAETQP